MFTTQYITFRKSLFYGTTVAYHSYKCFDGTTVRCSSQYAWSYDFGMGMRYGHCKQLQADSSATGVYFGTGKTPAKITDYTLENVITTGLTITSGGVVEASPGDGVYEFLSTFSVKNTSAENITISEVGYFASFKTGDIKPVLFERTVLASPITIKPGEVKIITYKLTFNQTQ